MWMKFHRKIVFVFKPIVHLRFVRDPLFRLVSAYYTINFFLWKNKVQWEKGHILQSDNFGNVSRMFKFWNTSGEPQRFRAFVDEMINNTSQFVSIHPLEHVMSLTASLAPFYGSDIHFVGRVENYARHWELLSKFDKCKGVVEYNQNQKIPHDMYLEGTYSPFPETWTLDPTYVKWLSLEHWNHSRDSKFELPAYKAIDQQLLNDIVEHYWQDYTCFGYDFDYPALNLRYTGKFYKDFIH